MLKTIIQVALAIISGLNTAIPLILDAQQLFPSWPWQIHALIGFIVFILVMIWIVLSYSVPLHRIENSRPNLIFEKSGEWALHSALQAIYHVVQVWFVNNPKIPSDNSVAKDITATVWIYDRDSKKSIKFPGCFIIAESFDYAGNRDFKQKIDEWQPNAEPRKLQIAVKWQEDDSAYGFTVVSDTPDQRMPHREIKKGKHYVQVIFKGTRVINRPPFWFTLDNPGKGGELSISQPIMTPDLRKEGFQTE